MGLVSRLGIARGHDTYEKLETNNDWYVHSTPYYLHKCAISRPPELKLDREAAPLGRSAQFDIYEGGGTWHSRLEVAVHPRSLGRAA